MTVGAELASARVLEPFSTGENIWREEMASIAPEVTSPGRVPRKPLSPKAIEGQDYRSSDEFKENSPDRRPLPELPLPSGRMQEAPLSPVTINFQTDQWARPSTAQIETVDSQLQGSNSSHQTSESSRYRNESSDATVHDVPTRQHYRSHEPTTRHESQHVILSNIDSTASSYFSEPSRDEGDQAPNAPISDGSSTSSGINIQSVPPLQYHHLQDEPVESGKPGMGQGNGQSSANVETGVGINRHLTPISTHFGRRSGIQRPASAYSIGSDMGPRGRSPVYLSQSPSWSGRALSAHSGTPEGSRPASYVDLLNAPYPQPPPVPHAAFNNSELRLAVGSNASLLSTQKTLEMYRLNVKKTNDPQTQYAFALLLIDAAREVDLSESDSTPTRKSSPKLGRDLESPYVETAATSAQDLLREARSILQKLADRSYPYAQYYLADGFASGLFNKGKEDHDRAFPLFAAASKHGHAESGYRAALCYEFGWGCRKDPLKAVQFYRQSASKTHPGAMTRLGRACLSGDLGLNKYREGLKWLKRATESADQQYNTAPYHLGLLYETGYGDDVFKDESYAAQLYTQAADLGHPEASYKLGDAYEHGKLSCPRDPALSVHFYTGAAQKGHPAAMMALCAWYMVGAEPVLEKDENEAYEWARRAAECGKDIRLTKVQECN